MEEEMDQEEKRPEETEEMAPEEMGADEVATDEHEEPKGTSGWVIAGLGGLAVLLGVAIVAVLAGALSKDEPAPIEPSGGADDFIVIVQPGQGAVLPVHESISIHGQAGGLFENSLVVQALDAEGNVLAHEPTTTDASEPGGVGSWSVDLVIPAQPGTKGLIFASSTSPEDGQIIASASVEVTYGEANQAVSEIKIDQPKDGAVLDTSVPVTVAGAGRGLFDNNVVVQVLAKTGDVIVQESTTMQTEEVGGVGTWSIDIRIPEGLGMKGTIRAFSTSPQDGSVDAESTVSIQYGEETPPDTSAGIQDLLWSVSSLGGNELVPGSVITMAFTSGEVNGSAGCNNYFGGHALSGNMISFGDFGTTLKACPEPPGLMDQENQYLTELQNAEAYSIDFKGLQMFGSAPPPTLFYNSVVMGTVGFIQPAEIPSGSTLIVQLQDTSLADAPAKVLGETMITDFSVIPILFSIRYDPTAIDTRFTYSISARIMDEAGDLILINTSAYSVITRGNPSVVEVIVEPV